jgi:ubiquinone/menaquinone biosynthesis C-methylase UbiE
MKSGCSDTMLPARDLRSGPDSVALEQDRLLREHYRSWSKTYDRAFRDYSSQTLAEAVDALGSPLPGRVLDLACGTGLLIERLVTLDATLSIVGVDISEDMLDHARRRFEGRSTIALRSGRAEAIPLPDASVDAVVIANAFHLVRDREAALRECQRVLVPGGSLVVVDWCRDALPMRVLAHGLALTQRLKRRIVGVRRMRAELEAAGFRVEIARRFRAKPLWGLMTFRARRPRNL